MGLEQLIEAPLSSETSEHALGVAFPSNELGDWYLLHTRSRQEKAVAEALRAQQIAFFLPLVRTARYYGRRKVLAELPRFPGYVFLRGSRSDAYAVDRLDRIVSIIAVADQAQLEWELRNLHQAIALGAKFELYPYLVVGTRVEVRAGPFRGLQGVVDRRLKENRLILQVTTLGRALSLDVGAEDLDPIR